MSNIYYLMGKSSSGKDTIYKRIKELHPELKTVTIYTTRPIREGEKNGKEYYFVNEEKLQQLLDDGKVIELRTYDTVHGPWNYFTVDDGQFDQDTADYLMIGTLESYQKMREYFGEERIVPLYIEVEDGERLMRALTRERMQKEPKYAEMCRRFLADEVDFSEEKLAEAGIEKRFVNKTLDETKQELMDYIRFYVG